MHEISFPGREFSREVATVQGGVTLTIHVLCDWGHPNLPVTVVSHGQTLFHTEGRVWDMAIEQWSAYQSQRSIQSHDT